MWKNIMKLRESYSSLVWNNIIHRHRVFNAYTRENKEKNETESIILIVNSVTSPLFCSIFLSFLMTHNGLIR